MEIRLNLVTILEGQEVPFHYLTIILVNTPKL